MTRHRHRVAESGPDYGYAGRVLNAGYAAGNIEREERCRCGATRWVAINGRFVVHTPWRLEAAKDRTF